MNTIPSSPKPINQVLIICDTSPYSVELNAKTLKLGNYVYKIAELSATRLKYYKDLAPVNGPTNIIYIFEH